ncbi:MAG: hypothetical protein N2652_03555 [Kiritimatiellae bacterium]|nr:hypothetical protein [Kiritimatiellia bacterium]
MSLWDPQDGRIVDLTAATEPDARLRVPLKLAPHGSVFIVLAGGPPPSSGGAPLDGAPEPVLQLDSPWQVAFQPGRGAPAAGVFEALQAGNEHPHERIRHFADVATYRQQVRLPVESIQPGARWYLDLGRVEVIARVRCNGREVGVVWTPPFRVELTSALREGPNDLEIEVANLWPNRLIADAAPPPEQRQTWTTWNPDRPGTPLLPSGLLGPVVLGRRRPR